MTDPTIPRRDFYVYVLFREDGITPFYIGKGKGTRWLHHERDARKGADNPFKDRIIIAMLNGCLAVPKIKLLEGLSDENAKQIERDMIRLVGRYPNGPLTNLTDGGDGVTNLPAESRARMGGWRGKPRSEETKAKLRAANLGKKHSAETKAKLSAISLAMSPESRARAAEASRHMSAETRAKLSEAGRGRVFSPETRAKLRAAQTPERRARSAAIRAAANKARVYTPEMRAKISEYARNRPIEIRQRQAAAIRGRKASPETRAKLSAARRRRKNSPEQIAKTAAWHRGRKRGDQARANIREGIRQKRNQRQLSLFNENTKKVPD